MNSADRTFRLPGPVKDLIDIRLDLQSWPEVEEYLKNCQGIILPIGSTEQHGPTGAIGTDAFTAQAVALEVGRKTGVFVAPIQPFGMAEHHLGFPGTMSLKPSTLILLLNDLFLSLLRNGFQRIYLINGHGGNIATIKAAFMQAYNSASSENIPNAKDFRFKLNNWFMAQEVSKFARENYGNKEGQHATPSEISMTLHIWPSLKNKQRPLKKPSPSGPIYGSEDFRIRYPDGRIGSDPYLANEYHGEKLLELASEALANDLTDFLISP